MVGRRTLTVSKWLSTAVAVVIAAAACGDDGGDATGSGGAGSGTGGAGAAAGAATTTGGVAGGAAVNGGAGPVTIVGDGVQITDDHGTFTCYPTACANHVLQCGNCEDDDGDGLYDWRDPECLGPCDNTEGPGLASDVGGDQGTTCTVDCYFDYGNGPGNDNCTWSHNCDELVPEPADCAYDASMLGGNKCPETQPAQCANICMPFTPNGCDCFGCCTFDALATAGPDGGPGHVWIGAMDASNASTCTFDEVTNEALCPRCTPVENCWNDCGRCEVCIGRPAPPADCFEDPPGSGGNGGSPPNLDQCPSGLQACGLEGQAQCSVDSVCISGCCQQVVR